MPYVLLAAAEAENEVSSKGLVFAALLFGCFAIFVFEITRRMPPEVTIEKLVALGIAICYLVAMIVAAYFDGLSLMALVGAVGTLLLALAWPLALIWFDNVIGNLVGLKSGLVSKASPGFLVRIMGWVLLLGLIGVSLYLCGAGEP